MTELLDLLLENVVLKEIKFTRLHGEALKPGSSRDDEQDTTAQPADSTATTGDLSEASVLDKRPKKRKDIQQQKWTLKIVVSEDTYIDILIALETNTDHANFCVEATAHYHVKREAFSDFDLRSDEWKSSFLAFAQQQGYLDLFPYIREATDNLAQRMKTSPPKISQRGSAESLRQKIRAELDSASAEN